MRVVIEICCGLVLLAPTLAAQAGDGAPSAVDLAAAAAAAEQPPGAAPNCVVCHSDPALAPEPRLRAPARFIGRDVHYELGMSCPDCHGGDAEVDPHAADAVQRAHAEEAGFRGPPEPAEVPAFCGRCHSDAAIMDRYVPAARVDQEAQYRTSVHGQQLAKGDTRVAQCLSCHGRLPDEPGAERTAHGIRSVSDPRSPVFPTHVAETCGHCHSDAGRMKAYDLPTDQVTLYESSVHYHQLVDNEDLSAPTCNDCHGNHGAKPPRVESLANVCGACHGHQAKLFRQSAMMTAFDFMDLGECTVCHGNHGIQKPDDGMLVSNAAHLSEGAMACSECHDEDDDEGLVAAAEMHAAIGGLDAQVKAAEATVVEAELKGMPVSEARYVLATATDSLVESRVLIHGWSADPVAEATGKGAKAAEEAQGLGQGAIADYFFRHRWLGISLVGIAIVIASLWLKLRQVDRRWRESLDSAN